MLVIIFDPLLDGTLSNFSDQLTETKYLRNLLEVLAFLCTKVKLLLYLDMQHLPIFITDVCKVFIDMII